jgi:hypothetical protein
MTVDPDTLRQVRAASVANLSKAERADDLRTRGWRNFTAANSNDGNPATVSRQPSPVPVRSKLSPISNGRRDCIRRSSSSRHTARKATAAVVSTCESILATHG